jgi:hypothetical protein
MDDLKTRAEARLDAALAEADVQDPRDHYRRALKALRQRDPDGFDAALRYFEEDLIPAVAGDADPIDTWIEYGTMLARTLGEGRTVELDGTGRARPVYDVKAARGLVLHLPDDTATPAFALRCPRTPTPAQQAALELLVDGRQTASAYG